MSESRDAGAGGPGVQPPPELNPRREPALDFQEKPLDAMSPADYDALGFLSGLEVHQQLDTASKLFCRCPAGVTATRTDARALRHMRPTLSELGEYDRTALMEFKTRKEVVYLLDRTTVCTYELDDTPPFEIDRDAVRIAVELASLCDLNLVSELHVMRKQYLDGSIPTGFQRTAMVGLTGEVPLRVPELGIDKPLRIRQLSLEEDSCREVSDVGHRVTFRTDRLGMPLTEVVTEPDLLTPWELAAGGRLLAEIARATGRIRRGPGAARQDVNVSVAGGRRVEIKGVARHTGLPLLVHTEGFRQLELLRIREELRRRGVEPGQLRDPEEGRAWEASDLMADIGSVLGGVTFRPIAEAWERGDTILAVRLPGFRGLIGHRTQPGLDFGYELAERVRVIACPIHRPFLLHSDAPETGAAGTLPAGAWRQARSAVGAEEDDAVVVVWMPEQDADTAAREILIRAREALHGVPAETRQARPDGRTRFERLLPGPDRMYPDTDTPPLPLPDSLIQAIRAELPERPWQRVTRYRELGLDDAHARRLARAAWADAFDAADPAPGDTARRLAHGLAKRAPFHARRLGIDLAGRFAPRTAADPMDAVGLDGTRLAPLVDALERGDVVPSALDIILDALSRHRSTPAGEVVARHRRLKEDGPLESAVEAAVEAALARARVDLDGRDGDVVARWAMGRVMRRLWGRVEPDRVREALREALDASEKLEVLQ